jgi:hypothetical protein
MTIRKRDDSVKSGKGIDDDLGSDFTKSYAKDPWGYGGASTKGGSEGNGHEPSDERSYAGAYTENESGLVQGEDFQYSAGVRSIWDDTTANQDPDVSTANNAIRAGVSRSQRDGSKDPTRRGK